jgi:hypothetical protein
MTVVTPAGIEPATSWASTRRSCRLSYRVISRDGRTRTCDFLTPNQAPYQAGLHPECGPGPAVDRPGVEPGILLFARQALYQLELAAHDRRT